MALRLGRNYFLIGCLFSDDFLAQYLKLLIRPTIRLENLFIIVLTMNYACKLSFHVKKEIIFATDEDIVRKYKAELYVLNRIAGKRVSER